MNPLTYTKLFGALALAGLAFLAGWQTQGWRMGREASETAQHASTAAAAVLAQRTGERDALAAGLRMSDDLHATQLRESQDETNRLRDRVSAGTGSLRIAAHCPASGPVPSASAASGVDPGAGAELDATARSAYFALRDGIDRASAQLAACQEQLRKRAAVTP